MSFTHAKDCADWKAAALDRKQRDAQLLLRETRLQALAHTVWFDWYRKYPRQTILSDARDPAAKEKAHV